MSLLQWRQDSALENHMLFIANSTAVASQTHPVSPVYMASASQTASSNGQAMTAQPELQKRRMRPACAPQKQEVDNTSYEGRKA